MIKNLKYLAPQFRLRSSKRVVKKSLSLLAWSKNALQNGSLCYHAYIGIYICMSVYSSLQSFVYLYRVLPGFREFAVFEKINRFFILFF